MGDGIAANTDHCRQKEPRDASRRIIFRTTNPSVYAWREGIALRFAGEREARSWDLGYLPATSLTLVLPALWAWRRWRPQTQSPESKAVPADELRKRIDFYLPTALVIALMFGLAAMAVDARHPAAWLTVAPIEVALIANLVARQKLKTRLRWLLTGHCPACGYDLTGNLTGTCPECGRTSQV